MQNTMDLLIRYTPSLMEGLGYTMVISVVSALIGEVLGLILALLRMTNNKVINWVVGVYISLVRGTPLLIQILVIYYALAVVGIDIPAFETGVIALSLNSGGFIAEILRGGFQAIPKGQYEAGYTLGMSKFAVLRRLILPQVIKIVLPQFITEFINVIKVSPLLSMITIVELTRACQKAVTATYVCLPFYIETAIIYMILCIVLEAVVNFISKKMNMVSNTV